MAHFLSKSEKESITLPNYPKCLKKGVHSCVEEVKIKEFTGGPLINPPTVSVQWG